MRPGEPATGSGAGGREPVLAFVVTEDWFFVSHFLHLARAAREAGFRPVVVARVDRHRAAIEAAGAELVDFAPGRVGNDPRALLRNARSLARILGGLRPEIVHLISLRSILIGGLAARLAKVPATAVAVTGFGHLATRRDLWGRLQRSAVTAVISRLIRTARTGFIFENRDDAALFGFVPSDPGAIVVGGAGLDLDAFRPPPLPPLPPLRLALVARMIRSKGVDTAVEAVALARRRGADVTLSLYGEADPFNPGAIPRETLEAWGRREEIGWYGRTEDVASVWAAHHAAILPSRGGEGLPRTLLEAAACGRAILTTRVPGCRDFVREGQDGFVVLPDDPETLADAILSLASDPERVTAMGRSARERVEGGYGEREVGAAMAGLWCKLVFGARGSASA